MKQNSLSDPRLAAAITWRASKQTYAIIRLLVDRPLVDDAYRAYGYFRWLDDWLDEGAHTQSERLNIIRWQQALMESCYRGVIPPNLSPEERMLADLIQHDTERNSGLQTYIRNMMAVMAFDAERRGRLISRRELNNYTRWLSTAVTEALHYFIGHNCAAPCGSLRYVAVTGAHITHMLRDGIEDFEAGYYNIPHELVPGKLIEPGDANNAEYRNWVKAGVRKARLCFKNGRDYLSQVQSFRCRLAGYAYIHRFEVVLDSIEREDYVLRADYPERKSLSQGVSMLAWSLHMALKYRRPLPVSSTVPVR